MIRLALILALAAVLLSERVEAQMMACQASLPVPGSAMPANVDVLSPTNGARVVLALGGEVPDDVVAVVVIRGAQTVTIFVMRDGWACRGPPVPLVNYERARRTALGVDG